MSRLGVMRALELGQLPIVSRAPHPQEGQRTSRAACRCSAAARRWRLHVVHSADGVPFAPQGEQPAELLALHFAVKVRPGVSFFKSGVAARGGGDVDLLGGVARGAANQVERVSVRFREAHHDARRVRAVAQLRVEGCRLVQRACRRHTHAQGFGQRLLVLELLEILLLLSLVKL